MSRLLTLILALALTTLVFVSFSASAVNGTFTIGANDNNSRYPIGLDPSANGTSFPNFQAGGTYQQVYAQSAFSGPVTITQLAFASHELTSNPGIANYDFNVSLGATAASPNALSTSLAANRGPQLVPVFSGPLAANITDGAEFDVLIDITPFTYDPANGNLLLEINFNAPVQFSGGSLLYFRAGSDSRTSRAASPAGIAGGEFTDSFGLQTRFTTTTTSPAEVTLGNLAQTYDGTPKSISATTVPAGLSVAVTYDGSAIAPTAAGVYAVTATITDPSFTGQNIGNLVIQKADQQITFNALANKAVGDADFNVNAAASSNLAVAFSAGGKCTVAGTLVHLTGAGDCTITASQSGNGNYHPAAPVARTFSIGKSDQQITFDALANKTVGDADFNVSATSSSNLAVAFAGQGSCTVNGTSVHLTGTGQCTITASQNGDADYNPAAPVGRTFSIGKADQQITFDPLSNKTLGDVDFNVSAAASSNLAVAFAAAGNCTVAGTEVHLTGAGACTIIGSQDGDATYNAATPVARAFQISKAEQQITFNALTNKTVGDADFEVGATASSNLAVSFSAAGNCTVTGAQVHLTGAGACTITAAQEGNADYNPAAPVVRAFSIGKSDQQITFDPIANKTLGDVDFNVTPTTSSNLPVSLSATGDCTVTGTQIHLAGAGACTITASQVGDINYNAANPVARSFSIGKAEQQITFNALPNKTVGDADFGIDATTSSNLAVGFSAAGNCTVTAAQVHLTGAGVCAITASQNGDANYNPAAPVIREFAIGKADQQITFGALANKTVNDPDFNVSANASSNLAVTFSALGNCSVNGTQVHLTGAGQCTITASQDGDANYNVATPVARAFTIGKAEQQVTFDALANKTVGDADFQLSATASSTLAVAFSAAGNCTTAGKSVHLTGAGQCTVTASQDGNSDYNAATPVVRAFTIGKADQEITFDALANKKVGDADFNVTATASFGLAIGLAAAGNCSLNGTQAHLTGAGACTITAAQDGNADYNSAAPVARTFSINKADQQITFAALADKKVGDADINIDATASSNLNVALAVAGNCSLKGSQVRLTGAGQCTVTASQDGNADYNAANPVARTFAVGKADQQITFDALANKTVGDADFNVAASASSQLAVNFAAVGDCTVAGTLVHLTGAGQCSIIASQDGNADYSAAAPVARSFAIGKADQQITFAAPADKKFGDADFDVNATASSQLTVSLTAAGNCSVNGTKVHISGAGQCTITAAQDGNSDYNAATPVARAVAVAKADQQITFESLANKNVGDADFNLTATASSTLAVSFAASGNCTSNGAQVHLTGAGACTITASQDGDGNYNAAPAVARPFTINKADQLITFAALADKKVGDADFNVEANASSKLVVGLLPMGNCTLTGSTVHLTGAGQCTITASQDGNSDYNPAAAIARTFAIAKADQQIAFDALSNKAVGDADFNVDATVSSGLVVGLAAMGNCTITGTQVHLTGAGACTVTASQDGDADYNPADAVARTFSIAKADQQITFDALADKKVGDADFAVNASASSNLLVQLTATGNCTMNGSQIHLTEAGKCTIIASQDGDANYNAATAVSRGFAIADVVSNQALISFGSPTYEVTEKVGVVRLTITRSGDTSGTTTVDYVTDDTGAATDCAKGTGLASSRCDFNTAVGTLKFAPGETEKTIEVLINQDSYVEAPFETFTVKLSNPTGGAALGATSTASVQIDDVSGGLAPSFNVVDDTHAFVRQQYHDFLNREPDVAGLNFWSDNIDQCNDAARKPAQLTLAQCKQVMRVNTSAAFFLSIEFSQTGGLVHGFYAAALDRPNGLPGNLEFIRDTQAVGHGVVVGEDNWQQKLNENREAFMKDFVTRPEFVGLYPTVDSPAAYVNKLYLHALGRQPSAGELEQAVNEFGGSANADDAGARARALLRVTKADDFAGEANRSFVQMQYIGYLRRNANELPDADFSGYEFWLRKLNQFKGNFIDAEMVRAFIESGEYRARFGP
jgi:large repetitive protein